MFKISTLTRSKLIAISKDQLVPFTKFKNYLILNNILASNSVDQKNVMKIPKRKYGDYYDKKNYESEIYYWMGACISGLCFVTTLFSNSNLSLQNPLITLLDLFFFAMIIGVSSIIWPLSWIVMLSSNGQF